MPAVAAIIPTYNREHCIARTIKSVLAQTFRDIEVIVVDDGSTDATRDIVEGFGAPVRYIRQENSGQGPARNRGVAATDAPLIAFLDSDDVWLPEKLSRQLRFMTDSGVDVSFTDFVLRKDLTGDGYDSWSAELKRRGRQTGTDGGVLADPLRVVAGPGDLVFTSTVMMKRDMFLRSGGYIPEFRRCQDVELHLRLSMSGVWGFLDEPLSIKDWSENASSERTYLYRTAALRSAMDFAAEHRGAEAVRLLRAVMRHEYRALSGMRRGQGEMLASCVALLGVVFPHVMAATPPALASRDHAR